MKRKASSRLRQLRQCSPPLGAAAVYAQDKYSLKSRAESRSPTSGIRGLVVVSSARTDEVLKVIVANPTMTEAYKAGVPGNGQPFRMAPRS